MNASHHPSDDVLVSYAAGALDEPTSILIATHLALCPTCRGVVSKAESIGGELLAEVEPSDIGDDALNAVLNRLDEEEVQSTQSALSAAENLGVEEDELNLPQPLKGYLKGSAKTLPWRWLGPGVHYTRIAQDAAGPNVGLLRIAPGTRVPMHGHSGNELTMVLAGGFTDATGSYARGDVESADDGLVHQPVADAGEECVCLVVTEGDLQPTGLIAKLLQPFFRL